MKKLLLTFLIAFITALGLNAADLTSPYSHTFASGELSEAAGSNTLSGVSWSWDAMKFLYFDNTKGVQIGAGSQEKYQGTDWTISTTGISGTITAVKVNTSVASKGGATVKVSVGGTAFKIGNSESKSFANTTPADYEFKGSASGEIVITMKSTKVKAMYLKSISVTFTSGGGSSETKELGPIKMGSTEISTDETNPTTTTVKGGGAISFTSENAASMIVYQDGVQNVSTGESPITWKAPEATDSEQSFSLRIHSQLQNEGEDLQEKDAYMTVTVPAKGKKQTFELLTDLSDVNEENTYILYGVTKTNNGVMSKSVTSDHFNALSSYTLTDNVITIPADATDVAIITLESNNDGKYYLKTQDNKYIQTSTSNTSLKDTKSGATAFKISVRDAIAHTISIYSGSAYFTYNGNSCSWFKGYKGHQSSTYLYVKRAAQVAPEAPTFTPDGGEVDLFSTVKIACATEGATLTYKIGDGEATAYPADGIKMTEAGEVTITAIATKGRLSTETTKTFKVTDNREEVYVRFDANKYEFTVGEKFESPVAKAYTYNNGDFVEIPDFTETINYESDNTNVAEVNATTGALILKAAGTCNITASLESETYKSDPAHYTLKVNKGLVDGTISYKTNSFTYTIGSEATLPELVKEPADVDVEYSISHERMENGVAVYNPATIDEQGNITVNTPGIVTVTATVKADRSKTASYVLEIQSLKEAEIAGTGSATPTGNEYNKINGKYDIDGKTLYAILSCCNGKVYAMTPKPNVNEAGNEANDGFLATVVNNNATELADKYTIDNPDMALFLYDANLDCFTYNDNGTTKYLVEASRHLKFVEEQPSGKKLDYDGYAGNYYDALKIDDLPLYCNPTQGYFNTFESNSQLGTYLFNCFLYKVGTAMSSASTVKAPVVHITGGNVYYGHDGKWYWGTEDESHKLSFANETEGADIYYIKSSATPSSANVRAMANSATGILYSTPFKKSDLDGKKITFWAVKDGQKSAVETLNFNIKTGIEDIDVENAEAIEEEGDARYFNLQGLEVKNPGEGIYIRVANGKATKILKK